MTFLNKLMAKLLLLALFAATPCLAQEGGGGVPVGPDPNAGLKTLGMMIFFFVIMWVILIRPQRKREKERTEMVGKLKAGDRVEASGLLGTVVTVKDDTLMIRSGDSKMEVFKSVVTAIPHGEKKPD